MVTSDTPQCRSAEPPIIVVSGRLSRALCIQHIERSTVLFQRLPSSRFETAAYRLIGGGGASDDEEVRVRDVHVADAKDRADFAQVWLAQGGRVAGGKSSIEFNIPSIMRVKDERKELRQYHSDRLHCSVAGFLRVCLPDTVPWHRGRSQPPRRQAARRTRRLLRNPSRACQLRSASCSAPEASSRWLRASGRSRRTAF